MLMVMWVPGVVLAAPVVFYTDIVSGPNSGGEGGNGAYLSVFGKGFGGSQGSSTVTINGVAVAAYKFWSDTQVSVQPGPAVTSGPIVVTVGGQASNNDHSFTVRSGRIFFVAPNGDDSTGVVGDITHPFRNPQTVFDNSVQPGDQIVLRAGSGWNFASNNQYNSFFSFNHKSDPSVRYDSFVLMGYPGETVVLNGQPGVTGVNSWDNSGGFTVANLHFMLGGSVDACISWPPGSSPTNTVSYIRIVNTELTGATTTGGGGSACIAGRGQHISILGNQIHDNGANKLYHAIYINNNDRTGTFDVEIAYNTIYNQYGGRGIQIYDAATSGIDDVRVHHNIIHDIALDAILFGEASATNMVAYDNLVYRADVPAFQTPDATGGSCLRFNNVNLVATIYNNTFYDCAVDGVSGSAGIRFENAQSITLRNNIVDTTGADGYFRKSHCHVGCVE